jgi:hypothetical protein
MFTLDQYVQFKDSTGAFLIGELERLDQEMHGPLVEFTWGRDIELREDVSMADEASSFTNSTFAAVGGTKPTGKSWAGKTANAIAGLALDIGKLANPLYLWAMEIGYTIPELLSAQQLGRPIDAQKLEALQLKWQMDTDEMVYIGDVDLGKYGMLNSDRVASGNVAAGVSGSLLWSKKTPDEITGDISDLCYTAYEASGFKAYPSKLILPPAKLNYIGTTKVSEAGSETILSYIKEKMVMPKEKNGKPLEFVDCKWCAAAARGAATDRMLAYTQIRRYVRYPQVPLQRTPLEYRSLYHLTTYFGRLGCVEWVYPETAAYADGF